MEYQENSIEAVLRCILIAALGDNILAAEEDMLLAFSFEIEKRHLEKLLQQELDIEESIIDAVKKDIRDSLGPITLSEPTDLDDYIFICASKVVSNELRQRTLRAAKKVASADGLHKTEAYVLQRLADVWGNIS